MGKKESNARYYEKTRDRIIFRESELSPSAIDELITCLQELGTHHADKRIARLQSLRVALVGD